VNPRTGALVVLAPSGSGCLVGYLVSGRLAEVSEDPDGYWCYRRSSQLYICCCELSAGLLEEVRVAAAAIGAELERSLAGGGSLAGIE
jgi:hypothetical protein